MSAVALYRLGDVSEFIRGITFKPDDVIDISDPSAVACMRTKNVQANLDRSDVWAIPPSFVKRPEQFLREGDILVSTANSWNLVGKCCWVPRLTQKTTLGGFISALRSTSDNLDSRYLYHWFSFGHVQELVRNCARKTTNIANLSFDQCLALRIPLPPLVEQKRISAILDQADDLRRKRQRSIDRLNQLGQAIFYEMFGDPKTNPHGFPTLPLGDLIKVSSGSGLIASDQKGGDYPVYGGNGVNGWHDDFTVPAGTIVIGRVGVYCGAVHVTDRSAWVTDNALVVSLKRPVNPTYIAAALKIANLNQYAGRSAQPLVSGSRIYPIEILNPPIGKQGLYESKIREFEAITSTHRDASAVTENLFSALQHRAFQGEL